MIRAASVGFALVLTALAALASAGCDKRKPENVVGADFTLKTDPAIPFHLANDSIVVPVGVAALVHVHVHGDGPNGEFSSAVHIFPTNQTIFSYTVVDLGNNDFIFYGRAPGLTTLKIVPADTSNGDGGQVCIPVAVTEQDGFLIGEAEDAGTDATDAGVLDSGMADSGAIDSAITDSLDAAEAPSDATDAD